jgi:cyclopropane-fatty-acyl-phospholipid synthase
MQTRLARSAGVVLEAGMKMNKTFLDMPVARGEGTGASRHVTAAERWLVRSLMEHAGSPRVRIRLWDGATHYEGGERPVGTVHIRNRAALWRMLRNPNLGFGDGYSLGGIEVEGDLVTILEAIFRTQVERNENSAIQRFIARGLTRQRANTLRGSRENIHHHYDLGNEFYQLWLDGDMVYTCAYFQEPTATLEAAQQAKMEHVCRKLRLRPGETVVEAGCGWGSLARYMAKHHGVKVRAFNISHEQVRYARERAKAEGLDGQVEYIEDDYRNIDGCYDAFVSVGMLEHVGMHNYPVLGETIDRALSPQGRGLIHSIGKNRTAPTGAWTEKRLFPGGYTPTLREMMDIFEGPGFSVLDVENIRLHYALTLEHWLQRYEAHLDQVRESFDEFFVRAWRLYLAASIANFRAGSLQLFQVVFARPTQNELPWTRAHLYAEET